MIQPMFKVLLVCGPVFLRLCYIEPLVYGAKLWRIVPGVVLPGNVRY